MMFSCSSSEEEVDPLVGSWLYSTESSETLVDENNYETEVPGTANISVVFTATGVTLNIAFESTEPDAFSSACTSVGTWVSETTGDEGAEINTLTMTWGAPAENIDPCSEGIEVFTYVLSGDTCAITDDEGELVGNFLRQ